MKRSVQDTPVVFIGAGNLATNLAKALYQNGFRIVQVYSRTKEAACALAQAIEAEYTTELSEVSRDARLYIVSLKDAAFVELLPEIVAGKEDALLVHTAGSSDEHLGRKNFALRCVFILCRLSANSARWISVRFLSS